MTCSELRKRLRVAREDLGAKDEIIRKKSERGDRLEAELIKMTRQREAMTPDQKLLERRAAINTQFMAMSTQIRVIGRDIRELFEESNPIEHEAFLAGLFCGLIHEVNITRDELLIPHKAADDMTPDWAKPDYQCTELDLSNLPPHLAHLNPNKQ